MEYIKHTKNIFNKFETNQKQSSASSRSKGWRRFCSSWRAPPLLCRWWTGPSRWPTQRSGTSPKWCFDSRCSGLYRTSAGRCSWRRLSLRLVWCWAKRSRHTKCTWAPWVSDKKWNRKEWWWTCEFEPFRKFKKFYPKNWETLTNCKNNFNIIFLQDCWSWKILTFKKQKGELIKAYFFSLKEKATSTNFLKLKL